MAASRAHVQHTVGNCAWRICPDPHCERRPAGRDGKLSGGAALLARACQAASGGGSLWNTRGLAHGTVSRFCWHWRRGHLTLKKGRKKTPANTWREAKPSRNCGWKLRTAWAQCLTLPNLARARRGEHRASCQQGRTTCGARCGRNRTMHLLGAWTTSKPELKLRGEVQLPSSMESAGRLRGNLRRLPSSLDNSNIKR